LHEAPERFHPGKDKVEINESFGKCTRLGRAKAGEDREEKVMVVHIVRRGSNALQEGSHDISPNGGHKKENLLEEWNIGPGSGNRHRGFYVTTKNRM
jgi:hypothetical protein